MSAQAAVGPSPEELPLLEAKLAKPRPRAGVIPRARLFDALDRLESSELTVISGPAGSGKTVLVSSWLAARPDLATAWTTLDASDDDPVRLWTYVSYAVDRVCLDIARGAVEGRVGPHRDRGGHHLVAHDQPARVDTVRRDGGVWQRLHVGGRISKVPAALGAAYDHALDPVRPPEDLHRARDVALGDQPTGQG